jgi:hypothetical protein
MTAATSVEKQIRVILTVLYGPKMGHFSVGTFGSHALKGEQMG